MRIDIGYAYPDKSEQVLGNGNASQYTGYSNCMLHSLILTITGLLIAGIISKRFNWPHPIVLIAVGLLIALIPGAPVPYIDPEIVLSVILPFLLYWEALNISLQGIRRALRGIILRGTLMVIFVFITVGVVGSAVGLSLAVALLIGAAVGPTDATAVEAMGKGIPRRAMLVLRAESMINDGTALVMFALAVEFATGDQEVSIGGTLFSFTKSFVGAIAVGLLLGWVVTRIGRLVTDPMIGNLFRLLMPFISYALADAIGGSGVLATVITGLYLGQTSPRFATMGSRVYGRPFWTMACYLLNGLLFLLVGTHLPDLYRSLESDTIRHVLLVIVVVFLTMTAARLIFGEVSIRLIRLLDRRESQLQRRTTFAERMVITMAGFRGAISIAVALSIPLSVEDRDVATFVTGGVVILSLVIQGVLMNPTIRWAARTPNPWRDPAPTDEQAELDAAYQESARRLLPQLEDIAAATGADINQVAAQRELLTPIAEAGCNPRSVILGQQDLEFEMALVRTKREIMIDLRDEGILDDEALIYVMDQLDIEELRLTGPLRAE